MPCGRLCVRARSRGFFVECVASYALENVLLGGRCAEARGSGLQDAERDLEELEVEKLKMEQRHNRDQVCWV
eukprot:3103928-Rhodomonas_salina.2